MPAGNSIRRSAKYSQVTLPVTRKDAKMVLISRLICATDTPSVAGAIKVRMRRTPGSLNFKVGRGNMPSFIRCGSIHASCNTPPNTTPQPSASTGGSKYGAIHKVAIIIATFSNAGAKAGTENRL